MSGWMKWRQCIPAFNSWSDNSEISASYLPLRTSASDGDSKVFGVPLARLVLESNSQVPFLVSDVVSFLSTHGLDEEGLFRVSGNARIIDKIRCCIEKDGCPVDFTPFEDDIAAVASILKTFLRELPEAVIPTSVHAMFIRAQADNEQNVEQCVWELRELVNAIPDAERDLLVYLCGFLRTVADHIDTTKMTAKALGIVFGPNLFRCSGGLEGLKEQAYTNHIVEKFILYHGDIFTELNFSSVPTSSCDSLDEPRPASADSVLMAERERVCHDARRPQRLSRTPEGWSVDSAPRRQSTCRQPSHPSTGHGSSGGRPVEYHVNHPKLCGVNSNSSCSSTRDPLSPPPYGYQPSVPSMNPPVPSREAMRPIDIDVSPWRAPRQIQHRHSTVLPGRVRNVVDRWEAGGGRGAAVDDTDASISADDLVYDSTPSHHSAAFSRNLSRRPRVAIPSVFLEDTKRKFEDQQRGAKDCDALSGPYSSPASSILDDIIRFLESGSPVKTSGEVSSGYLAGRNDDSAAHAETTDSSFKSIGARESGRRPKHVTSGKVHSVSSDDSLHYQLSNPAEAMTLSAGAHVKRARSLRTEARAARKQFSPLLQNDHKVTPRLPRRSPHSFSAGSPVPPAPHVVKQRRSRSDSSSRSEGAGRSTEEHSKTKENRGLRRSHGRAASFRHPPAVARRMPRVSSIERRKVQSLPPLELADDGDSEGCGEQAGRYLGQKRKRRQDKEDDVRLDADLLQLLREVQHSRQLASRESRNSNRDSSHATDEAGSKVVFSSRSSTPRLSGSWQHPSHAPRSTSDSYGSYHPPQASNKAQRWTTSVPSTKQHRGSYEARAPRGGRTPSSQEDQIRQVVNYISAKLTMKRTLGHRPSEFKDMTSDQLLSEKKNIQKCLLQYEAQFGRPNTEAERQLMRPLYEQYRIVKKYLQLAECSMRYCDSPRRDSASTVASSRQCSSVFSELELSDSPRHSRQSRPSQTFMPGGMIQPAMQPHSSIPVSSFGSVHSPGVCHSPGAVHPMQFMRGGGMAAASAAVPMTSPMALNQPLPAHATIVQSPLWWTTSLQRANRAQLLDLQLQVLLEKGQLRRLLKTFEEEFHRHTGRKITKTDRGRMTAEYDRYKYCKAQLKLLDALLSKPAAVAADGQQIAI